VAASEPSTSLPEELRHFLASTAGRDLPVMITVVETKDKLSQAAEAVEEMLQDGLIVVSDVDIVRLIRRTVPTRWRRAAQAFPASTP
jgi:transposase